MMNIRIYTPKHTVSPKSFQKRSKISTVSSALQREMVSPHVLLVTFPAQGHINPLLTFAKTLVRNGVRVTFSTGSFAQRRIAKAAGGDSNFSDLITFAPFSDDGSKPSHDHNQYMAEIRNRSSNTIRETILASAKQGKPVTCLVYSLLLPWAAAVAREMHVPSALLWIQPTTVLDIYYYYFNGYGEEISNSLDDPSWKIQLPGLPWLRRRDLPSFVLPPSNDHKVFALSTCKEHLEALDEETKPKVLVNTFDELEEDALKAIEDYDLIAIGPLIPSALLDGGDPSDKIIGGDLFNQSKEYRQWLNSKPESSVVYVSFGSVLKLPRVQMEEIGKGLVESGRPFLWVIRANDDPQEEDNYTKLSFYEELEKLGKIVPWCSQLEVLTHPSVGCFVSHCGWNSTLECISCGVPVVAFPQWADQGTSAKLIEDVSKTGIRVNPRADGIVETNEIKRCIETVMDGGEKSQEVRQNAKKWMNSAREAMKEDGSSTKNLKAFVKQLGN